MLVARLPLPVGPQVKVTGWVLPLSRGLHELPIVRVQQVDAGGLVPLPPQPHHFLQLELCLPADEDSGQGMFLALYPVPAGTPKVLLHGTPSHTAGGCVTEAEIIETQALGVGNAHLAFVDNDQYDWKVVEIGVGARSVLRVTIVVPELKPGQEGRLAQLPRLSGAGVVINVQADTESFPQSQCISQISNDFH